MTDHREKGILYICATPIGNLEDITLRVLRTLREVDVIAAEDTRITVKLLNYYDISTPLTSYHEHNKAQKGLLLVERLLHGENIALVTDSGMPGISDPGQELILLCYENGINVTVCPGATAGVAGLVLSGICAKRYAFEGFLPRGKKERRKALEAIVAEIRTIVLYEAPHRLLETLRDLLNSLGDRKIACIREITKKFEEVRKGQLADIVEYYAENSPRGEFVIVLEAAQTKEKMQWPTDLDGHMGMYFAKGLDEKEAMKMVAKDRAVSKSVIYHEYKINKK